MSNYDFNNVKVFGILNMDGYASGQYPVYTANAVNIILGVNSSYELTSDQDLGLKVIRDYWDNTLAEGSQSIKDDDATTANSFPLWANTYKVIHTGQKRRVLSVIALTANGTLYLSKKDAHGKVGAGGDKEGSTAYTNE